MLSIDPGVSGTGWVSWRDARPLRSGIVETAPGSSWQVRAYRVARALAAEYTQLGPSLVVCELMEFYGTGSGSAPWATGDLQRILVMSGWFIGLVDAKPRDVVLVRPSEWKGQLPKRVVVDRIKRILTPGVCKRVGFVSHSWDAAGIGLWARGLF